MTKTLNVCNREGYLALHRQDFGRTTDLAASLVRVSEPMPPPATSAVANDIGAISWGQTNW